MKDLRDLIKIANSEKRAEKGAAALKDIGLGVLADLIPGSGTVLTLAQALKGMYNAPDEKKTDTKLDLLNVDDEVSKIVDDTVEDNFFKKVTDQFKDLGDDETIPDMTAALSNYLKKTYDSRTVSGFSEGKRRGRLTISEGMRYHVENGVGLEDNVYRPGTPEFFDLFNEAREHWRNGNYEATVTEAELLESDIGLWAKFEGRMVPLDFPMWDEGTVNEAKYKGREVTLGAKGAKRSGGRAHVYVRDPKSGKVKKISFGSGMPDAMGDSEAHRKRRKSFASRHGCADKKDKMAAGYWACRATKMFGRNIPGWW
jgi:hypothetical protein